MIQIKEIEFAEFDPSSVIDIELIAFCDLVYCFIEVEWEIFIFCYNPLTEKWSEKNRMPEVFERLMPFVYESNLYALKYNGEYAIYHYDLASDRWNVSSFELNFKFYEKY